MDDFIEGIFLGEVTKQCQFAINAILGLNNVLGRLGDHTNPARDTLHNEVFRSIHSFLTHASNVSRLLWPSPLRKGRKESEEQYVARCEQHAPTVRARELRIIAGLPDEHALRSRRLRDHLEHFDERLDEWERTSKRRNFVQDVIGPKNAIAGLDESDMMRWFDNSTLHFRFRGEEFDLQLLARSIEDVQQKSVAARERLELARRERAIRRLKDGDPGANPSPTPTSDLTNVAADERSL